LVQLTEATVKRRDQVKHARQHYQQHGAPSPNILQGVTLSP